MDKRKTAVILFAVLIVLVLLFIDTRRIEKSERGIDFIQKPTAFIDAVFYKTEPVEGTCNLTLELFSKVEEADVYVDFMIPDDVNMISGARKWTGKIKNGEKEKIQIQVTRPSGVKRLIEVSIAASYEGRMSHTAKGLTVGESLEKQTAPKTDSKGRPVKEYEGEKKEG
ncbi:hypothetical protein ACFL4T_10455 [candidate division KSB1 bacterium]